jgi:hypothetical protein
MRDTRTPLGTHRTVSVAFIWSQVYTGSLNLNKSIVGRLRLLMVYTYVDTS